MVVGKLDDSFATQTALIGRSSPDKEEAQSEHVALRDAH